VRTAKSVTGLGDRRKRDHAEHRMATLRVDLGKSAVFYAGARSTAEAEIPQNPATAS
jgi:hypothetical protein